MPYITPSGLLGGDRINRVSDEAKKLWPFLFAGSNMYGRFCSTYSTIVSRCFSKWKTPPTKEEVQRALTEYKEQHLLFLYTVNGKPWGAFYSIRKPRERDLNRESRLSPAPPEPDFSNWERESKDRVDPTDDIRIGENLPEGRRPQELEEEPEIEEHKEVVKNSPPSIAIQDAWNELIEVAKTIPVMADSIPENGIYSDLCKKSFGPRDVEVKHKIITRLKEYRDSGAYDDPRYVHTLRNFIDKKVYEVAPRKKRKPVDIETKREFPSYLQACAAGEVKSPEEYRLKYRAS